MKIIILGIILVIFQGCMSSIAKKHMPTLELKEEKQIKNTTKYDDVLRCMDTLYSKTLEFEDGISSKDRIRVYVDKIENETADQEKIPNNIKTMLITSLSKLGNHLEILPDDPQTGKYYILKPAITEFDMLQSSGAGVNIGGSGGKGRGETDADSGGGYREKIMNMAIDFNVISVSGDLKRYEPYVSTSFNMKIINVKDSNDFSITIYGNGFGMNSNISKSQGIHAAIRLLVEVSLAELFGELDTIPYWKCIGGSVDRQYEDRIDYKYDLMKRTANMEQVVNYLKKWGLLPMDVNNQDYAKIENAIIKYKEMHNIHPINSDLSKEIWKSWLTTIPVIKDDTTDTKDLFKKYSFIEDIKVYSDALSKKKEHSSENYFEQIKKLDSVYRLYTKAKLSNTNTKLHIASYVDKNSRLSVANDNLSSVYGALVKKGINRRDIIKKSLKTKETCMSLNNDICQFKNSYILFNINN